MNPAGATDGRCPASVAAARAESPHAAARGPEEYAEKLTVMADDLRNALRRR